MKSPNIFDQANDALQILDENIGLLQKYRDEKAAQLAKHLRSRGGIELDSEAILATLDRPYTLLPINEHEAWLISSRIIRMPIMGYVVAVEPAFIKSKITRSGEWFTPFPQWIKDEMGWKAPEHKAHIDSDRTGVMVTDGDEATFKKRYGQFLNGKGSNGEFKIKGGNAWINLVASLVRDGILPYQPQPVADEHWDAKAKYSDELMRVLETLEWKTKRKYLERGVAQFKEDGATTFNLAPGAGKSLIIQMILTHLKGCKTLLCVDTSNLEAQWVRDLPLRSPNANVTVTTYQGAEKYAKMEWDFVVFDEAQRIPANSFSKLAFLKTKYRAGATGTAWREDNRQHLIIALCGRPFHIPWEEMIAAGILKKPQITVVTVKNEAEKIAFAKAYLSKRKGRSWVYCDWITRGQEIAKALNVPYIYGETKNGFQQIMDTEVCVVSRVADRGISVRDLRLVIELAGQGKSREQFGQRVGRLLHGEFEGQFFTVFTPAEIAKYKSRIFAVEAELGGQVEINFMEWASNGSSSLTKQPKTGATRLPAMIARKNATKVATKPLDEIGKILAIPSIAAKIVKAENVIADRWVKQMVPRVIRFCWNKTLTPEDITEGLGKGKSFNKGIGQACRACEKAGLMISMPNGAFSVDMKYIKRLQDLSELGKP